MVFQHKLEITEEAGLYFFPLFLLFRRESTHESGGSQKAAYIVQFILIL